MRQPVLLLLVLFAVPLTGCASTEYRPPLSEGLLSLGGILNPSLPPVNLTDAAINQFPPLRQLFNEWEARHPPGRPHNADDVSIRYHYEDGVGIIQGIQAKDRNVTWPQENRVLIAHEGRFFALLADKPH